MTSLLCNVHVVYYKNYKNKINALLASYNFYSSNIILTFFTNTPH